MKNRNRNILYTSIAICGLLVIGLLVYCWAYSATITKLKRDFVWEKIELRLSGCGLSLTEIIYLRFTVYGNGFVQKKLKSYTIEDGLIGYEYWKLVGN